MPPSPLIYRSGVWFRRRHNKHHTKGAYLIFRGWPYDPVNIFDNLHPSRAKLRDFSPRIFRQGDDDK